MRIFLHKQPVFEQPPLRSFINMVYLVLYSESRVTTSKIISPIPPAPKNGLPKCGTHEFC